MFDPNVALGKGREGEEREKGWKREKEWKKEWKKGGRERKDEGKEDVSAFGRRAFVRFRGGTPGEMWAMTEAIFEYIYLCRRRRVSRGSCGGEMGAMTNAVSEYIHTYTGTGDGADVDTLPSSEPSKV